MLCDSILFIDYIIGIKDFSNNTLSSSFLKSSLFCNFSSFCWIGPIPNSGVSVASGRDHDGGHDGGDVEGGPLGHELFKENLFVHAIVSPLFHLVLHWDSSRVVNWIRLVTIVVGLN